MRLFLATSLVLFCTHLSAFADSEAAWLRWARHVGEAEQSRERSLKRLKALPDLEKTLMSALRTPQRNFALDVIAALKMDHLLPQLLLEVESDPDGFLTLTLNSLMTADNRKLFEEAYPPLLLKAGVQPATLVALLEPLGRLGFKLSVADLEKLLSHSFPEVRSAALDYIRLRVQQGDVETAPVIMKALEDKDYHLRLQGFSLIEEILKAPESAVAKSFEKEALTKLCGTEKRKEVLKECKRALGEDVPDVAVPVLGPSSSYDIYIVFGYKDSRPARFVGDRHERLAFVQRLLEACKDKDDRACGFQRSSENSDLFYKKNPNSLSISKKKKTNRVRLLVVNSSVGTDDEANRKNPLQVYQSDYARRVFFDGLRRADAVFYNGHSRSGGGPDFKPPHLNALGRVDASLYKSYAAGFGNLTYEISRRSQSAKAPLKVLGLFSCASTQHFEKEVKRVSSTRLITSSKLIHYSEALQDSLKSLSSLLKGAE